LNAYRFSIAWARVLPEGTGAVNRAGLGFYDRLVDALLEHGIRPCVTLYHWDLPAALADRGGWANREIVDWFAEYARVVFEALGDRVPMWTTLNEPWVVTDAGYLHGVHAPGHRDLFETPRASHHLLLAHAAAVEVYRAIAKQKIGIVLNIEPKDAASDSAEDLAATRRADAYMNRQYLDPLFLGQYPDELPEMYGEAWPQFPSADLARIQAPIDFLGINYYTRAVVRHDEGALLTRASAVPQRQSTRSEMGWEVHPASLTRLFVWIHERYGSVPMYVTENGASFYDPPVAHGESVEDPLRVDYYRRHLRAVHDAMQAGVDVRGYFAWSLLDNFEWGLGYARRFGIVHVDFATQKRTPKASAHFYRDVIRTQGASLDS
jgi:beta-glucosidase